MENKYIIEIEESYSRDGWPNEDTPDVLYRVKGFNSLVFDQRGLNKLEKYDPDKEYDRGFERGYAYAKTENELPSDAEAYGYEKGYEKGLKDAWKAAKKISFPESEGGIAPEDMASVLGFTSWVHAMQKLTAAEAIAKIEAYEEKQKAEAEIRGGDEVQISTSGDTCRGVVWRVADKRGTKLVSVIQDDGFGIFNMRDNKIETTGRHFPEVAELLKKMKEGLPNEENS